MSNIKINEEYCPPIMESIMMEQSYMICQSGPYGSSSDSGSSEYTTDSDPTEDRF